MLFLNCCRDDNLEGVNECLGRGVNVNTKDNWGTGLMVACYRGNSAIVSRLVQVPGLDINYQDKKRGFTAAHWASLWGRTECVRILAETGRVDWNKRGEEGQTPLYEALGGGHSDTVEIIVQQPNIDYNVKTTLGESLGHAAAKGGNVENVKFLAAEERFHCWNLPDVDGDSPIMMALKEGMTKIVEILLRCSRVDLNGRDKEGWSLIFRAIQRNKLGRKCRNVSYNIESPVCRFREDDSVRVREVLPWLQPGPHCCGGGGGGGYQTPGSV